MALKYYMPIPKYVEIGKNAYVCDVRHGVSMLLVNESEVPSLLAFDGGCCGGTRKVFSLASQEAYNIWSTGER